MAITEEELKQYQDNLARNAVPEQKKDLTASVKIIPHPLRPFQRMRKTEIMYAATLENMKASGEIIDYRFEPIKFILTHGIPHKVNEMSYKIDFMVVYPGHFCFVEVKGCKAAEHEDSWVKLKTTCEMFPWFQFKKVYVNTKTREITEEVLT